MSEEGKFRVSVIGNVAVLVFILGGVWWMRGTIDDLIQSNHELARQVEQFQGVLKDQSDHVVRMTNGMDDLTKRMTNDETRATAYEGKVDALLSLLRTTLPAPSPSPSPQ